MMRRILLGFMGFTVVVGSLVLARPAGATPSGPEAAKTTTPIKHFVYLMQENHSFDSYFGTYPGADGLPSGVCVPRKLEDPTKGCVEPSSVGDRPVVDLRTSQPLFAAQSNGGRMDGFASAFGGDDNAAQLSMSHHDAKDLPWYWDVADNYVLFDRYFASSKGGAVANHMYWVAGTSGLPHTEDALPHAGWGDGIPTIFDRLEAAGISWKFYIQDYDPTVHEPPQSAKDKGAQVIRNPLLAMPRFRSNPDLAHKIVSVSEYYSDVERGSLPSVAFIVPSGSTSEHPPANIEAGEAFVRTLVTELMRSSSWDSSAFLWSYDDWGGFYDHVPPPEVDAFGYGFRVPALLVSPYAKRGHVDSTQLDHTSGLAFIRENWGIAPLADRDRNARSFTSAFDFDQPPRPPAFPSTGDTKRIAAANTTFLYPGYGFSLALPFVIAMGTVVRARRKQEA